MEVKFEKLDPLNATLTVDIQPEDYLDKYNSALQEFRKKGSFKGFRKGKTPMGYIKKIYGKAALADSVNEVLQKAVTEYLTEEKIETLGQPLPSKDQSAIDFDPKEPVEYNFSFDLGIAPTFAVQGLDAEIERFDVEVPDTIIDTEWENYRKRLGTTVDVDDPILSGDVFYVKVTEQESDADKPEGVTASFALQLDDLTEEVQQAVTGLKAGDSFTFNPAHLEEGKDIDFVRKYHLGLEGDSDVEISDNFKAEIERVTRQMPAEVNEDFFNKLFGEGKVTSEEEGRDEIRKGLKADIDRQADAVLYKQMQKSLMDANPMDLPEEFLKRWLESNREEKDPELTDEDMRDFLLDLRWQLIKDKIAEANNLEVTQQDIEQGAVRMIYQYVGPYGDRDTFNQLVSSVLQNREQVNRISREAMANKVFEVLRESFKVKDVPVSEDEFKEKSKEILND